ncbi:uncharacterized protein LOC108734859 isoform X2 [Agrilus planipennis]|uniref:Uncharacterized protein LOC108734859 isoform X2 n=1 Tax=Agrilus planipennis TaxID=224129 RepID=A0A1W4WPP1_AGRPL|nr:uncharacterized protein LOC108734859 isoform X2 [Agrilus planipennis]
MAETSMEEGVVEVQGHLVPCSICGRTFLPEPLKKHERICERNATRKRKIFNSQKQRVEGTELAVFHQKSYLKKTSGSSGSEQLDVKQPPPQRKSKWKEKHLELVKIIREARGAAVPSTEMSGDKRTTTSTTTNSSNEKCPTCDRAFGPKAYDRHVEWCREHKSRIQKSPANVLVAKERLEARTKYRVPPLNKSKRQTIKEKYASKKDSPHQSNLKSASSNNFETSPRTKSKDERQNELNRKATAGRHLTRGDSIRDNKPVPQKKEPRKGSVEDLIKSSKPKPSTMRGSGKVDSISVNSGVLGMSVTQITADEEVVKSPGRLTTWVEEQRKRHPIEKSPHCDLKMKLHESEMSLHGLSASTSNRLPVPMSLSNVCFSSVEELNSPSPLSISYTARDDSLGRHRSQETAIGRSPKFKVFGGSKYVERVISEKNLRSKDRDYKNEDKLKIDVDNDRFYINTFRNNDSSCASGRSGAQPVKTLVDIGIIDTKNDHNKGSLLTNADVVETGSVNSKQSGDLSARSDYSGKKQIKTLKTFKSRNTTNAKFTKHDNIYANLPKSIVEEITKENDNQISASYDENCNRNLKSKIKKKIPCDNLDIKETSAEENKTLQIEYESTNKTDLIKIKLREVNSEDSIVDIKTSSRVSSPIVTKTSGNLNCVSEDFDSLENINSDIGFHNYTYEGDSYPTSPKFENSFKYTSLKSSDEILAFSKNLVELVENSCNQLPIPSSESSQLLTDSTDTIISQDTCENNLVTRNITSIDKVEIKDSFNKFDSKDLLKSESKESFQNKKIYTERKKDDHVLYQLQMDRDTNDASETVLGKRKDNTNSDICQPSEYLWKQSNNLLKQPRSFQGKEEEFFCNDDDASRRDDVSAMICHFRKRIFGSKTRHNEPRCFEHRMIRGDVSKTFTKNKNLKHLRERLKKNSIDLRRNVQSQEDIFNYQHRPSQSFMHGLCSGVQMIEKEDFSSSINTTSEKEIKTIDYEICNSSSHTISRMERHESSKAYVPSDYHFSTNKTISENPVSTSPDGWILYIENRNSKNTTEQFAISSGDSICNSSNKTTKNGDYTSVDSRECLNFDSSDPSIFDTKESAHKAYNYDSGFGSVDEQSKKTTETSILKNYTKLQSVNVLRCGKPDVSQQYHCLISDGAHSKSDPECSQQTPLTEKNSDPSASVKLDDHIQESDSNSRKILKPKHKRKLESNDSSASIETQASYNSKETFNLKSVTLEKWQSSGSRNVPQKRDETPTATESKTVNLNKKEAGLVMGTIQKSYEQTPNQNQNSIEYSSIEQISSCTVENTHSQLLPSNIVNEIINVATGADLNKKNKIIKTEGNFSFKTTNDITEEIIEMFAISDSNVSEMPKECSREDPNKDLLGLVDKKPTQDECKDAGSTLNMINNSMSVSKFTQNTLELAQHRIDLVTTNNPEQNDQTVDLCTTTFAAIGAISADRVLDKNIQKAPKSIQEKSSKTSKIPVLEKSTFSRKIKKKNGQLEKYFKGEGHRSIHNCGESFLRALSESSLCEHRPLTLIRSSSESSIQAIVGSELINLINRKKEFQTSRNLKIFVVENKSQLVEEIDIPQQTIIYQERRYETAKSTEESDTNNIMHKKDLNVLKSEINQKNDIRQSNSTYTNEIVNCSPQVSLECLKFAPAHATDNADHFKKSSSKIRQSKRINSAAKRQTSSVQEASPLNAFLQSLSSSNLEKTSPTPSKLCSNQECKISESGGSIMTLSNASSWNTVKSTVFKKEVEQESDDLIIGDGNKDNGNTVKVFKEAETGFDDLESLDGDSSSVWVNALSSARLKESVRKCCSDVCVLKTFNLYANKGLEGLSRAISPRKTVEDRTEDEVEFPVTTVTSDSTSVDEMCSLTHSQIIRIAADDFLASCVPKQKVSPASSQEVIPKKRQKMSFKKGITSMAKKIVRCFCKNDKGKRSKMGKGMSQCSVRSKKRRKKKKTKSIITIANLANDRTKRGDSSELGLYVPEKYTDFQVPIQINTKFSNYQTAGWQAGDKKLTNALEDGSNKVNETCLLCFFNVTGGNLCKHDEIIVSSPKRLNETNTKMESSLITNTGDSPKDDFYLPIINVKAARKSAAKPKETTPVSLPPIDSKNQDYQSSNKSSKEKARCDNRSLSLLEPAIKSRPQKPKELIHCKQDRRSPDRKSPGHQQIASKEIKRHEQESIKVSTFKATADDLFAVDDELYEEYKKYEEMYLKEKQQKMQQTSDVSDDLYSPGKDDIQLSQKNSGDSAYSSLNRKPSKIRARSTKLTPLDCQKMNTESTSSSGTDTSSTSPSHPHPIGVQHQQQKVPKFCHECGSKYPIDSAKFCVDCGVKRLLL